MKATLPKHIEEPKLTSLNPIPDKARSSSSPPQKINKMLASKARKAKHSKKKQPATAKRVMRVKRRRS